MIRTVHLCPLYTVDNGLELREAACDCMDMLLSTCLHRIQPAAFITPFLISGLSGAYTLLTQQLLFAHLAQAHSRMPKAFPSNTGLMKILYSHFQSLNSWPLPSINPLPSPHPVSPSSIVDNSDLKMPCHLVLAKLVEKCAPSVLAMVDAPVEPLEKTVTIRVKADAMKQEVDRNEDMILSENARAWIKQVGWLEEAGESCGGGDCMTP
ncbi:unnamed protein product [Closterium sp. NIES-65]|nr:unnamed protein product [Closterium sp. NIES-65]